MSPGGQALEARDRGVRAAGEVDRARGARLVHRHHGVAVADDPGAVAERAVERLPEHDPGVLDRVVGAGLQVAGDARPRGRAGRGGPAGRACGRGSRRRWRAARAAPSRPSASATSVSPVVRVISAVRAHRAPILPHAGLHRLGVHDEALGAGDRRARPRRARAAAAADADLRHPPPEVARRSARTRSGRRRRWAACGSSPRRSRRTRCALARADEQAARACARAARAPRPPRPPAAGARARAPRRTRARPRDRPSRARGRRDARPARSSAARDRVQQRRVVAHRDDQRARRRARPGPAGRAPTSSGSAPADAMHARSLGPAKPSMPTCPRPGAWPPAPTGCPGPTITSTGADRLGARRRARRSPARRPSGRPRRRRTARAAARITGCAGRAPRRPRRRRPRAR